MSFAADLKDFASNFRDTYKTLHTSGRDELASEQAKSWRQQRELEAKADTEISAAGANAGQGTGAERSSDPSNLRAPSMAMPGAIGEYANAIQRVESSGNPRAMGPVTASGDRAYGLYQVMGKNIPAWTKAALGRAYTPEEFVADVPAQNRTFQHRFGSYVQKYGNPEDAASVWFTGLPYAEALRRGRGDQLGTRVQDYVRKFKSGLGRRVALDDVTDEEAPVVYAATGGVIPSGLNRALDTTESEGAGSNPVTRDVMDAEHSSVDDDFDPSPLLDINSARQAVAGGLKFGQRLLGLETHHAAVPEAAPVNPDGVTALQTNAGAPTREEMAVVDQTIRADKVPPELRQIARMNAGYQFWIARGDKSRAEGYAWGMLSAAKRAASQYGALALSIDDPVKRAQVIAKGYNELVPDGETVKITGKGENGGARFELHDPSGKLTEKGTLAVDDMVKMATGMSNGTEYLRSMVNFATAAPTAREKRDEADIAALNKFTEASDSMVIDSMSDDERKALNEIKSPSVRFKAVEEKRKAMKMEYGQEQDALKRDDKIENRDYQRDWAQFKTALAQNNFDVKRNDVLTNAEKKFFLFEKDLDDRNRRFDQSQTARRERDATRAEQLLRSRVERAATQGIRLTAPEARDARRAAAIDTAEQEGVAAAESTVPFTPGGSEGAMEERRARAIETATGPARAQAAYQRIAPAERAIDEGDFAEIRKKVPEVWKETKNPTDHLVASQIAAEIRAASGNKLTNDDAVNMTMQALSGNAEPRVVNGRLQIGNLPPVALSGESLIQLAAMRARVTEKERQGKYGVDYRSQTALPGATAPTSSAAVRSETERIKGQRALELSPPETALSRGLRATGRALMPDVDRAEADRQAVEFLRRDEERRQRMRRTGLAR